MDVETSPMLFLVTVQGILNQIVIFFFVFVPKPHQSISGALSLHTTLKAERLVDSPVSQLANYVKTFHG